MLKLIVSLVFMYVTALSAISNEALQSAKTVTNSKPSYASLLSPQIRSDESELLKLLGKWEVSTGQIDAEMINYFNISYVGMGDNYFEAFGTDSLIDYSSGDALECLYDLGSTYSQKYVCISMIYEGMYNWYFFNLVDSNTIDGVYVFSSVDNIEENYAWTTSLLHGKKEGTGTATPSEDIISSNLSALKSDLLNTKTYSVSGSFAAYDFAGVDAAFDWAFVTPKNDVYQLQGNAPSANDAFGWKQVYVNPDEPAWYMAYLDDWDGDGNSKYDWILVGNGFDAVYKLEGVTATGNFSYSKKIDVQYSVSSDKKTISFGTSSSSDNDISNGDSYEKDIGSDGGEIKVPGAYVSIPSSAFSAKNAVSITTSLNNSFDTAQSIQEFYMKGIPENFSKPITLAAKQVDTQSNILLFKTENYIKSLDKTEETYTIVEGEVNDGYITYVIEPESLLKSAKRSGVGYFSVGWAALKGYKVFDTKKGHFRIYFPDAWLNEALDLEEHLEDAYSYYENMGFDLTRRTSWPMSVTIFQFTGGETGDSGYYNQSKRGAFSNNYGHITINRKYIGEPQTIKATTVHELFHFAQSLYYPSTLGIKHGNASLWFDEACSVWSEGDYMGGGYTSALLPANIYYVLEKFSNTQNYGYAMSSLVKEMVTQTSTKTLFEIYSEYYSGGNDITSYVEKHFGDMSFLWWPRFIQSYIEGKIYNDVDPIMLSNIAKKASDLVPGLKYKSSMELSDWQTQMYYFPFPKDAADSVDINMTVEIEGDISDCTITAFNFDKSKNSFFKIDDRGQKITLKNINKLSKAGSRGILVVVTNAHIKDGFSTKKDIELTAKITGLDFSKLNQLKIMMAIDDSLFIWNEEIVDEDGNSMILVHEDEGIAFPSFWEEDDYLLCDINSYSAGTFNASCYSSELNYNLALVLTLDSEKNPTVFKSFSMNMSDSHGSSMQATLHNIPLKLSDIQVNDDGYVSLLKDFIQGNQYHGIGSQYCDYFESLSGYYYIESDGPYTLQRYDCSGGGQIFIEMSIK